MSILNFPENRFIRVVDTDEVVRMGGFTVVNSGQLQYVRALIYIKNIIVTTERFRIKIFSDQAYTSLLYTSEWTTLSDYSTIKRIASGDGWYGWVAAEFNKENISNQSVYYLAFEVDDYTINGNTSFISLVYDTHVPVYDNATVRFFQHPRSFLIYLYENVT